MICAVLGLGAVLLALGCTPAQTTRAKADGQLFCAAATPAGPLVVAIEDAAGVPVVVTGMESAGVKAVCAVINAIPAEPPADITNAPVVAVAVPAGVVIPAKPPA